MALGESEPCDVHLTKTAVLPCKRYMKMELLHAGYVALSQQVRQMPIPINFVPAAAYDDGTGT
jgi:hypothetical protein